MVIYYIVCFIFVFLLVCCISAFVLMRKKYKQLHSDLSKILVAVKRARYGDFNVRVENLYIKEIETAVNRLLETMYDREIMIKEYQSALANKNLSLEEILKQEKQLQSFKEEFAATLTHDMKVPVIAELNSLNFLIEGRFGDLNEKQLEILKLMKSSNQELKDLIENMLETYKLDNKKPELNISPCNLNEFLLSIIDEMMPIIYESNHKITADLAETQNKTILIDSFQMKRVIKNLIQNAVTFSNPDFEIKIRTQLTNSVVKVMFTNKGSTISQDELNLIFEKYYSRHSQFRKVGTGLGLYLAQQITLAHNGNITVECNSEGYTTFTVALPLE